MDASKKQREPVAFKSLAELKRFIRPGVEFKTVSHANHAEFLHKKVWKKVWKMLDFCRTER